MSDIDVRFNRGPSGPECQRQMTLHQDADVVHLRFDDEAWLEGILRERRTGRELLKEPAS